MEGDTDRRPTDCEYKLHFLVDSLTQTGASKRKQLRAESGVTSPSAENGLSSKPFICRTMTTGRLYNNYREDDSQKQHFYSDNQTGTLRNQRRSKQIQSRRQSSSKSVINSPLSPKEENMRENIEVESRNMSSYKLAKSLSEEGCQRRRGSGKSSSDMEGCHYHHHLSPSSVSSHPSNNYYHSTGHRWTFGMGLLILVIISTFSASSTVMCVPLGHQNDGGGGDFGSASSAESTHRNGLMMPNSRIWGLQRNEMDEPATSYKILPKGQVYLPSLLNNGPVKAAEEAMASAADYSSEGSEGGSAIKRGPQQSNRHGTTSNYHLQQFHHGENGDGTPFKHSAQIQKLLTQQQEKDGSRSVTIGKDLDEEEDDDATTPTGLREYDDAGSANALGQSEWETVIDPHLYVLTEWDSPPYQEQFPLLHQQRKRRNSGTGPSLSIVNPLDVLRQRLLLEIARRRMRQSHNQIIANEEILRKIGRRRR